ADSKSRSKNRVAVNEALAERTRRYKSAELVERLEKGGVASGPIYRMNEMFEDPQVRHVKMAAPVHHPALGDIHVVNQPFVLSRTPSEIRTATPERGEH